MVIKVWWRYSAASIGLFGTDSSCSQFSLVKLTKLPASPNMYIRVRAISNESGGGKRRGAGGGGTGGCSCAEEGVRGHVRGGNDQWNIGLIPRTDVPAGRVYLRVKLGNVCVEQTTRTDFAMSTVKQYAGELSQTGIYTEVNSKDWHFSRGLGILDDD